MYPSSGENTGLHGCREHALALGANGVARKKFYGSRFVGKCHLPSVLCQYGTTPGPYPKRFEPGNELLAPGTSRNMFCILKVAFPISDEKPVFRTPQPKPVY